VRRQVVTAMSGLTAVVLVVALRAGQPHPSPITAAVGIVVASQSASPSATVRPRTTPSAAAPPARRRHKPRPVATASRTAYATPRPRRTATPKPTSVTVNGAVVDTNYGPVQVQITVSGGRITRADAIVYPQGSGRDQEINSYAIPQLDQETLDAQSANIDTVSGATYTSDGYRRSLQSAIDAVHAR
jgi:uncharacterized protein with FMN-binding domain